MEENKEVISTEERREILEQCIIGVTAQLGYRLESRTEFSATVISGAKVNHVLHLLLSIVTAGLWIIVWVLIGLTGGEQRWFIYVDEYGNDSAWKLPK